MVGQATRITMLDEIRSTFSSDRWSEFFADYGQLLRRWLISHQVNPADADDIQQETMIAVLNELPNFEHNGRPGAFRLWLKRILTNRIKRVFTDKKRRKEENCNLDSLAKTLADEKTEISLTFQREHEQFLIQQLLSRAEAHFSPKRIEMFVELVLKGVPIEELVKRYDMNSGAIRVQQHRILKWLKYTGAGMIDL